eukprot:3882870-Pleurochrysis_carterae.AAC.1
MRRPLHLPRPPMPGRPVPARRRGRRHAARPSKKKVNDAGYGLLELSYTSQIATGAWASHVSEIGWIDAG